MGKRTNGYNSECSIHSFIHLDAAEELKMFPNILLLLLQIKYLIISGHSQLSEVAKRLNDVQLLFDF